MSFFSIIIPTFNRKDVVIRALKSTLVQTFDDFEVVIVDNGSTDGTESSIRLFSSSDSRIRYFWQENSGSPAGSRNTGIKVATGEWIVFLDSDDCFEPTKLQKVYAMIQQQPDLVAVVHDADVMVGSRKIETRSVSKGIGDKSAWDSLFYRGNFVSTSAMVVKAQTIRKVGTFNPSPDYAMVEDYDLWLRIARLGNFGYICESLSLLMQEEDQLSRNIDRQQDNLLHLLQNHIQAMDISESKRQELLLWAQARVEYFKAKAWYRAKDMVRCRQHARKSLQLNWKDLRTLYFALLSLPPL